MFIVFAAAFTAMAEPDRPCPASRSPQSCYEQYLQAIPRAKHLRDLYAFLSSDRVQHLERSLTAVQAKGIDPAQIELETLKVLRQGSIRPDRITEHRYEREASLRVERAGLIMDIRLTIEDAQWRIADERLRANPRF